MGSTACSLGYALPAAMTVPVNGRLAAGNPEGSQALALGSLREFVRQLVRLPPPRPRRARHPATLATGSVCPYQPTPARRAHITRLIYNNHYAHDTFEHQITSVVQEP